MFEKKLIHGTDVHKDLYLNYEIHGPWDRGSGPREDQNGHIVRID